MAGWVSAALAALALGAAPGGAAHGPALKPGAGACELRGADRARTSSLRCMACHDGGSGPFVEFHMSTAGAAGMSHPVEVDYGAAAARHPRQYVSPRALPRDVPLVEGKVACTSCHDGASRNRNHVAMPQRLCESCHSDK